MDKFQPSCTVDASLCFAATLAFMGIRRSVANTLKHLEAFFCASLLLSCLILVRFRVARIFVEMRRRKHVVTTRPQERRLPCWRRRD